MKKFDANELYNATMKSIHDAINKGKEVQSHYGVKVNEHLAEFDVGYQCGDNSKCDYHWEHLTNDERNLVLTMELHNAIEQVKARGMGWGMFSTIICAHPDYFGPIANYDFPKEFVEWGMEYLG